MYYESVYGIAIEGEIVYIGKAINPQKRFYEHIYKCRSVNPKKDLYRYLRMQILSDIFPELIILGVTKSDKIMTMESEMIRKYSDTGLFNRRGNYAIPHDYPFINYSEFSQKALDFFKQVNNNCVPTKYPI